MEWLFNLMQEHPDVNIDFTFIKGTLREYDMLSIRLTVVYDHKPITTGIWMYVNQEEERIRAAIERVFESLEAFKEKENNDP